MPRDSRPWRCPRTLDGWICPAPRHDDLRGYKKGCRSGSATAANTATKAAWRRGERPALVDATATVRMLRALGAEGHPIEDIAAAMHCSRSFVHEHRSGVHDRILETTAAAAAAAYDEVSRRPPPVGFYPDRTRRLAAAKGWEPVPAWTEDTIGDPDAAPWSHVELEPVDPRVLVDALRARRVAWDDVDRGEQELVITALRETQTLAQIADTVGADPAAIDRIAQSMTARARRARQPRPAPSAPRPAAARSVSAATVERVHARLHELADRGGVVRRSARAIGTDLGVTHSSIRAALRALEDGGHLTVARVPGPGRPTVVTLHQQPATGAKAA